MDGSSLEISDSSDEERGGCIPNLQITLNRNNDNTATSERAPHAHNMHHNVPRPGIPAGPGLPGHSRVEFDVPRPSFSGPGIPPPRFAEPNILNPNQPEPRGENVTHIREELNSRGMEVADSIGMCSPGAVSIMNHLNRVVNENTIRVARLAEQIRLRRNAIPLENASANNRRNPRDSPRKRRRDYFYKYYIGLLGLTKRRNVSQNTTRGAEDPQPSTSRALRGPAESVGDRITRALAELRAAQMEHGCVQSEKKVRGAPRPAEPPQAPGLETAAHSCSQHRGGADPQPSTSRVVHDCAAFMREQPRQPQLEQPQPHGQPPERQQPQPERQQPHPERQQPHPERQQPQPEQQQLQQLQPEQQLQRQPPEHQQQPQAHPPEQQRPLREKHQMQGQKLEVQPPQEKQANSVVKDGKVGSPIEVSPMCLKLNQSLLTLLECPVCMEWMDPPMAQCRRGHLICQVCRTRLLRCPVCRAAFTSVRNRAMEQVAEKLRFPCRYTCGALVLLRQRARHEANCPRRLYSCPMPGCAGSPDSPPMLYAALKAHHLKKHSASIILEDKGKFNVIPEVNEYRDWIMFSHHQMFHIKFSNDDRNWGIHCSVAFVGPKSDARKYVYKVKLSARNGVRKHTFTRETHHHLDMKRADSFHVSIEQAKQFKQNERNNMLQFAVRVQVNPQAHVGKGDETP